MCVYVCMCICVNMLEMIVLIYNFTVQNVRMARGKVDNVSVILAVLWPHMKVGILLESFNAVTDYSI